MGRLARVFVAVLMVGGTLGVVSAVSPEVPASADQSQYTEFYTPPDPLPAGQPGDLIRSEPSRLVLEPSGQLGAYEATGTRIMYRSNDTHGRPDAVTGTHFEPDNGAGAAAPSRRLVAMSGWTAKGPPSGVGPPLKRE